MTDFEDFVEFVNYVRSNGVSGPRRYLRDYSDPFTKYSIREFKKKYRFTPNAVKNKLIPMLEPELSRQKTTGRGLPFAPEVMVLITLRYFATGSVQKLQGDVMDICQQSVSRIIAKVSVLLANKMKYYVKYPTTATEINKVKEKFYGIAEFPGVIGCIGCTHIKIRSPGGLASEVYRNRNGWFSIIVQAVTGPNSEFYDVVARWPGSTQDNFVFDNSTIKQRLNTGVLQGVLLGHNGYEVSEVLLTPFLSPNCNGQEKYNESHSKTRHTVEKAFSVLIRKFPCLHIGMGTKIDTVVAVICACVTLYNIAHALDELTDPDDDDEVPDSTVSVEHMQENPNSNGFLFRQAIVDRFFN